MTRCDHDSQQRLDSRDRKRARRQPAGALFGAIRSITCADGWLTIRGWVASANAIRITGFRVACAHVNLRRVSWRYGVSDRDAKKRIGIANCGFEIRARMKEAGDTRFGSLVCVTPMIGSRGRWTMFAVWRPSIPRPPRKEWALVGSSFLQEACVALGLLVNYASLERSDSILDVGCGVGRVAYVLAYYLRATGRYEGLEPIRRWVRWNRAVLNGRFPRFHFTELPVFNALYNPTGWVSGNRLRFPCPDSSFDVASVLSVFQHNRAAVVRNYLGEIARVLRPGGRVVITCFLLDATPPVRALRDDGVEFVHPLPDCGWTATPELPERGIAFLFSDFCRWVAHCGLSISERIEGRWRGCTATPFFQDIVVLEKA